MPPHPPVRWTRIARLLIPALLLTVAGPVGKTLAGPSGDGTIDTGERFRTPLLSEEWRVLRRTATGEKFLERADGVRVATVEEVVLAEEASVGPLRAAVDPALLGAVQDPARSEESLRVVLLLRDQPLHRVSRDVRALVEPGLRARAARMREILDRIGPLRERGAARRMQLGDRLEEERRLLTEAERAELARLRDEVQALSRGMRKEILDSARPVTTAQQAPVLAWIESIPGARVLGTAAILNAVSAEIPAGRIRGLLEDLPEVGRVIAHHAFKVLLDSSVPSIGAAAWTNAGYDGSSTTKVAILDTGIDTTHPSMTGVVSQQGIFLAAGILDPYFQDNAGSADDILGHGTTVAGIVSSQDATYRGVAPGATLLNAKCGYIAFDPNDPSYVVGMVLEADAMAAADWAATNGAGTMNCSFGDPGSTYGSSGISLLLDAMADGLGISVAAGAGNSGGPHGVGFPADAFNVITVGAYDHAHSAGPSDDSLWKFSSYGPLDDGRRKPDLCAPGVEVKAPFAHWEGAAADFISPSGTSLSAPHAAGALAILEDYAAAWRTETLKAILMNAARHGEPVPDLRGNAWGTGALDLATAFADRGSVFESTFANTGPSHVLFRCGPLAAGDRATLCWNRLVVPNGFSKPTTYLAPVDLDLAAFREGEGTLLDESASALDTVEQVSIPAASPSTILRVRRSGGFPAGQIAVNWSVATSSGTAPRVVEPPRINVEFSPIAASVAAGEEFTVTARVGNDGGCAAGGPVVTLELPPYYNVVSGANPATLPSVPTGGKQSATWKVRAAGPNRGERTFSATAISTTYGESQLVRATSGVQSMTSVTPPGGFRPAGGLGYVMPWQDVTADADYQDWTGGAAAEATRTRWAAGEWTPWAMATGAAIVLPRPAVEGLVDATIQYRLPGDYVTPTYTAPFYLVEAAPASLDGLGTLEGRLDPGGDVDAFPFGMVAGARFDASVRWKPAGAREDDRIMTDLHVEDGKAVVLGRYPDSSTSPGIHGFTAPETGTYWLVVRAAGEERAAGGTYGVRARITTPAGERRANGAVEAEGDPAAFSVSFVAVEGTTLGGKLSGEGIGALSIVTPEGDTIPLTGISSSGGSRVKIAPVLLKGGTGTYRLSGGASGPVRYRLRLGPPRPGKLGEPK